jgi:hypothetical protein
MIRYENLAWAAGFFDGEGTTYRRLNGYKRTTNKSKQPQTVDYLQVAVSQVNKEPLVRFAQVVGGKVNGPYGPYRPSKRPYYQWFASSARASKVLTMLWPYLTKIKRTQARKAGYIEES